MIELDIIDITTMFDPVDADLAVKTANVKRTDTVTITPHSHS
jgi:hypothetical protein